MKHRATPFLVNCFVMATFLVASTLAAEPPSNPKTADSPWPQFHRGPSAQASTPLTGPRTTDPVVQIRTFLADADRQFGTSPWHALSGKGYVDDPNARTLWGSSLEYLYKYVISGEEFVYADFYRTNYLPLSITWNFFILEGDRVIMPNPGGLLTTLGPCRSDVTSILEFRDGETTDSPIECVKKFELTTERITAACGPVVPAAFATSANLVPLFSGDIAVQIVDDSTDPQSSYLAIVDNDLTEIRTCAQVDDSTTTNVYPVEPLTETKSAMYIATEGGVVKMTYDGATNELTRIWKQDYAFRAGRTGTTPTLVGFGGDRFVIALDARCAVDDVINGNIACDPDTSPSRLVAFRRDDEPGPIDTIDLPEFLDTVENSPSARDTTVVVCDYSGYTPDGPKDGEADFAKGIVAVSWNIATQAWQTDWSNDTLQCSGVPTISEGSNRVYFSGAEEADGITYQYAIRLADDVDGPAGEVTLRQPIGPAFESENGANDGLFDAGNNTVINDDGSLIWPAGNSLVRVFDRTPDQVGFVSDGRTSPPLRLGKQPDGNVDLTWSVSCGDPGEDYAVYSGTLGQFDVLEPVTCSTTNNLTFTTNEPGDRFYLVVPNNGGSVGAIEGSYGIDSTGSERTPAAVACFPQSVSSCP